MIDVGNAIDQAHDLTLESCGQPLPRVIADTVSHLVGEVETAPIALEHLHHTHALLVVQKPAAVLVAQDVVEGVLPRMTERRMAEVVPHGDGLDQILIQPHRPCDRPTDRGHLKRVGEARAVVVTLRRDKDLGLVLETPEGLCVNDAVAVALKCCAEWARVLCHTSGRVLRTCGPGTERGFPHLRRAGGRPAPAGWETTTGPGRPRRPCAGRPPRRCAQ